MRAQFLLLLLFASCVQFCQPSRAQGSDIKSLRKMFTNENELLRTMHGESAGTKQSDMSLGLKHCTIKVHGVERTYFVHEPPSYKGKTPVPLLLAFHGMTMKTRQMPKLTGLNQYADKHSFLVVYPEGLNEQWMFGLGVGDIADVDFSVALLEKLSKDYKIDRTRVYAAGISNGGFFSQFLILNRPDLFAAVAAVAATMEETTYKKLKPTRPTSVMFMHGDDDSIIPYEGGSMGVSSTLDDRGIHRCVPVQDAAKYWVKADGCNPKPVVTKLPDAKPPDDTHVVRESWTGGKNGSEVILFTIKNGGHTWPSGFQYMPVPIVGATTHAIDANDEMWKSFNATIYSGSKFSLIQSTAANFDGSRSELFTVQQQF